MRTLRYFTGLFFSLAGTTMAQTGNDHSLYSALRDELPGHSYIEIQLDNHAALAISINQYKQAIVRQNIDSVLRLFISDYHQINDTVQHSTDAVRAVFKLNLTDRQLDLRVTSQLTHSYRFRDDDDPALLKKKQDTLQIDWTISSSRINGQALPIYLFVNNLEDVERLINSGGVNQRLRLMLESIQQYDKRDLTNKKFSFDALHSLNGQSHILRAGRSYKSMLDVQPSVGIGLVRNQWVPSAAIRLQYLPSRFHTVSYGIDYTSQFFFESNPTGKFQTFRNDFLSIGLTFYRSRKVGNTSPYSQQIFSFYVGLPVHRQGEFFDPNTIRLNSTVYHRGLLKIQPEVYMSGFFQRVYPGLRLSVGL